MSNDEIIDFLTQIELELMSSSLSTRPRHSRDGGANERDNQPNLKLRFLEQIT